MSSMQSENRSGVLGSLDSAAAVVAGFREQMTKSATMMARLSGWLFVAISLFITSDIITRKLFLFSSRATDEYSNYGFAFATSWAMGYALLTKAHVRVDVLLVRFPPAVQGYLNTFALVLVNFMMAYVVYFAWHTVFFSFQIGAQAPTIQRTPLAWPQSVWAVGLTFFWFVAFIMLVETLLDLARGKARELAHKIGPLSVQAEIDEALEAAGLEATTAEEAKK